MIGYSIRAQGLGLGQLEDSEEVEAWQVELEVSGGDSGIFRHSSALCHPRNFHDRATDATRPAIGNGLTTPRRIQSEARARAFLTFVTPFVMAFPYSVALSILLVQSMCRSVNPESMTPSHTPCQCHSPPGAVDTLTCARSITRRPCPLTVEPLPPCRRRPRPCTTDAITYVGGRRCQLRAAVALARASSTPSSTHHVECCQRPCLHAVDALDPALLTSLSVHPRPCVPNALGLDHKLKDYCEPCNAHSCERRCIMQVRIERGVRAQIEETTFPNLPVQVLKKNTCSSFGAIIKC